MEHTSPRRRDRSAVRKANKEADQAMAWLAVEESTVREQIVDLERFIVRAPELAERADRAERARRNLLPPPDDDDTVCTAAPPLRPTRAQLAAHRRRRSLNLAVFVLVAGAACACCLWLAHNL